MSPDPAPPPAPPTPDAPGGGPFTVGIDVGTTAVKALAVAADGSVVARARVPHGHLGADPTHLEHDADRAWRAGVASAWRQVSQGRDVAAVEVAAMVPSLCPVGPDGRPTGPGILYGDARGGPRAGASPLESGEAGHLLAWCVAHHPEAAGYWPAQAVAGHALCGVAAVDPITALTLSPLWAGAGWDPGAVAAAGARVDQLPAVVEGERAVGATAGGSLVGPGTVDALAEQLVSGADEVGDVLVILGSTLITWVVAPTCRAVPGLWAVLHPRGLEPGGPGGLVGGPSTAGGLFLDWVDGWCRPAAAPVPGAAVARPDGVPVWVPHHRGERTPTHDPGARAALHDLHAGHGPAEVRRAAREASAFVVRRHVELVGVPPRRVVATGGGARDGAWVQALADGTGLPVDVVAVPEGGALGAAWLARVVAGLEDPATVTSGARRWARTGHRVLPDPAAAPAVEIRYRRFLDLAPGPRPA